MNLPAPRTTALVLSVLIHLAVFAVLSVGKPTVDYSVQPGLTSLEIVSVQSRHLTEAEKKFSEPLDHLSIDQLLSLPELEKRQLATELTVEVFKTAKATYELKNPSKELSKRSTDTASKPRETLDRSYAKSSVDTSSDQAQRLLTEVAVLNEQISTAQASTADVGAFFARPQIVSNPAPVYPWVAKKKEWEGTVRVKALVSKGGDVRQVEVLESSGYELLDSSALAAIVQWKFKPQEGQVKAENFWTIVPVEFKLVN